MQEQYTQNIVCILLDILKVRQDLPILMGHCDSILCATRRTLHMQVSNKAFHVDHVDITLKENLT